MLLADVTRAGLWNLSGAILGNWGKAGGQMLRGGRASVGEPEVLNPEESAVVRRHLEAVLASHAFAGARRTQEFLRLIVRHALDGEIDALRERMIGAELFGRPIGYDTGNDSVVRVRASEVRKKLGQYYSELGRTEPPVHIELPSGSYVPRFHFPPYALETLPHTQPQPAATEPAVTAAATENDSALDHEAKPEEANLPAVPIVPKPALSRKNPLYLATSLALVLLALGAFLLFERGNRSSSTPAGIHSVAVLPLENLSGTPEQDYFADGMTEELINDLGQVSALRVISLTSSMSYRGTKKKLPEIARELTVDGIVEGGVLREGNQVRISVQLIDARTDRPVWAHTYVRDLTGVLDWQGEVAKTIAEEISTEVSPQEQARLAHRHPIDSRAQDSYLHGILLRQADDCKNAIGYFDRAIENDPGYAEAHSALASCYGRLGESGRMPYEQAFTQQKEEALRAIELDDSLSEAHAELGNTAMTLDRDWPAADAQFHRALQLNPNSATSHEKYAFYLVRTGQFRDAISEIERSVDLDPVSASTFHAEGFIYYFSRRYDQALAVTRTVQGLKINLPDWDFLIGDICAEKGALSESIAAFLRSGDGPYTLGHLGNAYARAGQLEAARRTIARLQQDVQKDDVGRYEIALIYAGLGNKKEAFQWLEDALQAHDAGLVYLKVDPCLDPLRSDPRFDDLMRRAGLSK
jgi:TolB-like protein/Flp pilus assembly protein TadD